MSLAVFNSAAFLSAAGLAIAASATVEVRREDTSALASIFSDEAGTTPITNPSAFADTEGRFAFYAAGIEHGYSVNIIKGAENFTIHNVAIGTAAQFDVTALLGLWNSAQLLENIGLLVTVAGNALTVALKDTSGADPSSDSPVRIGFRSATLATGTPDVIEVVAASSIVVSSGSTLGTVSTKPHRIYIVGINDAGTFRLGLRNPWDATSNTLLALNEQDVYSSTAEGGAGAADSSEAIYTGTAATAKAVRILGYFESTQATAGTWATAASKVQVMGEGVARTGDVVQTVATTLSAVATGTTTIPLDDTIPQNTEGTQFITAAITPSSAINLLEIHHHGLYSSSAPLHVTSALFQDSVANALHAMAINIATNAADIHNWIYRMLAATVAQTTFKVRAGTATAGTTTFNGRGGVRSFGGVCNSYLKATEIFV